MNNSGTDTLKKIGDVAQMLGTTPRTLRYYEEEGLIVSRRTEGGTRFYSQQDITRLRIILKLTKLGLPINDIKQLAITRTQCLTGAQASENVLPLVQTLLKSINEQKQFYEALEQDLETAAQVIHQCDECQNPPSRKGCPICPINENLTHSEILHLIWDQEQRHWGR
ncbi:MAG: MerR family transcriptional regulator [Candidatus Parabeggiatoa sp.]|nr:MerR family transcriptional regulator [Candidatus Parabeggiatoa sp.]